MHESARATKEGSQTPRVWTMEPPDVYSCARPPRPRRRVPRASGTRRGPDRGFEETIFQGGLSSPTAIAFLPDARILITEKAGALKLSDGSSC
jgi:glucose/arabinose dehydrogenase